MDCYEVTLREISEVITKGTTPTTYGFNFTDKGVNFIKVESINEDGSFDTDKFTHISDECHDKLCRSKLCHGDILFSITGAIGRTAIVDDTLLPANTNQAFAIIRLKQEVQIEYSYLIHALKSEGVIKQYELQKQGIAQINLSLKNIGDLVVPLPNIESQKLFANFIHQTDKSKLTVQCTFNSLGVMLFNKELFRR